MLELQFFRNYENLNWLLSLSPTENVTVTWLKNINIFQINQIRLAESICKNKPSWLIKQNNLLSQSVTFKKHQTCQSLEILDQPNLVRRYIKKSEIFDIYVIPTWLLKAASFLFKGPLSGLRQFLTTDSPLKMMKTIFILC